MLYSANYNHRGAAKTWYGVPGAEAEAFERCFEKAMPDLFAAQPDLLLQLVTMLSPSLLQSDGVPVYRTDQNAGEFVVTFPRSYHCGFNAGFNVAEAVNFAPADWLRFGADGAARYRFYRKPSVLCHDELICTVAEEAEESGKLNQDLARWLLPDLKRLRDEERAGREKLAQEGVVRSRWYAPKKLAAKAKERKLERDAAESERRVSAAEAASASPPGGSGPAKEKEKGDNNKTGGERGERGRGSKRGKAAKEAKEAKEAAEASSPEKGAAAANAANDDLAGSGAPKHSSLDASAALVSSSSGDYSAYLPARNANGAYDRECTICRYILHVSGVACACNPDRPACLRHSAELCDCPNAKRVMFYRKSVARLERMCREVERHAGCKKQKSSEKAQNQKDAAATKARVKRAAAWVREAKAALTAAAKRPPRADIAAPLEPSKGVSDEGSNPLAELERLAVAAEEFTWAGEEMDETRAVAAKVHVAVAFQKELAVLKRRVAAAEIEGADKDLRSLWSAEPASAVDDADVVVAAAAGAPMRVRRGGKYVAMETEQEAAVRRREEEKQELQKRRADAEGKGTAENENAAGEERTASPKKEPGEAKEAAKEQEYPAPSPGAGPDAASAAVPAKPAAAAPPRRMALVRLRQLLDAAPFPLSAADSAAFAEALRAAEDLEHRVVQALGERPHPNPKKCVSLAAETARGPLEVTSARRLKDAVAAAHAWSERARKALPGRRHRASLNRAELPTLADLARLKRDAAGLPVQPNDLQALDAAAEETTAWAAEAAALLRPARQKGKSGASSSPPTLEEAEKALVVGAAVPARCDELEALELAVEEARAWVEEAREADEADRPVEVLEALVEKATNGSLRVVPREVEALAERARVRAWADPAAKVAAGKPRVGSLAEVRECVRAGAEIIEGPSASEPGEREQGALALAEEKKGSAGKRKSSDKSATAAAEAKKPARALAPVDDANVADAERALLERLRSIVRQGEAWERRAAAFASVREQRRSRPG